jgi:hypothetical protein
VDSSGRITCSIAGRTRSMTSRMLSTLPTSERRRLGGAERASGWGRRHRAAIQQATTEPMAVASEARRLLPRRTPRR